MTEQEYIEALGEIETLWNIPPDSPLSKRFDQLVEMVCVYESDKDFMDLKTKTK